MKKTSLAISILLVFSLIVVVSCRKEVFLDYILEKMSDEDPFVREARLSFQNEYGKKKVKFRSSVASVAPDRDRKITINIQPAWSFAKNVNTPKLQGVEVPVLESIASRKMFNYDKVPISPEDNKLRARNSFKRLLYYKTSNGKSFNIVLTYLPDVAYVKKFSGRISKGSLNMRTVKAAKYSGYIEYSRLDGRGIFVLQFKEGKVVRRHTYKYKKSVELPVSNVAFKSSSTNGGVENGGTSTPMASAMWGDTEQCEECVPIEIRVCAGELEEEEVEDEDCGEWTDSGQEECTPIECPEVEPPEDPGDDCWPHCDDPCYDEYGYYICDPENPDPGNPDPDNPDPDEPESPPIDCAGVLFGTAYEASCGCIGGTTGFVDCDDPCAQKRMVKNQESSSSNTLANSDLLTNLNSSNPAVSGIEYGSEKNLMSPNLESNYLNPNVRSGMSSSFSPNFTWDSINGYTLGVTHSHPGQSAPSPSDVMWMFDRITEPSLVNAGSTDVQFFKDNVSVTAVTTNGNYVVTIKDWDGIANLGSKTSLNAAFLAAGEEYYDLNSTATNAEATEYALLKVFGDTINLYKNTLNSTEYTPLELNTMTNKVTNKNC